MQGEAKPYMRELDAVRPEQWRNIAAPVRDAMQVMSSNQNFSLSKLVMIANQLKVMERQARSRDERQK